MGAAEFQRSARFSFVGKLVDGLIGSVKNDLYFLDRASGPLLADEAKRSEKKKKKKKRGRSWSGRDANRVAMAVAVKVKFVNETSGTAGKAK